MTATDTNPLYMDFIPSFIRAWSFLVPEAYIRIVLIADAIPDHLQKYSQHIVLVAPIPGVHTAFHAQCIRLLYPREVTRDEGVLITDMDMLPMNRRYYVETINDVSSDTFVVYRDVCLPNEISMCYNIAHPSVWRSMFGDQPTDELLTEWHRPTNYDGQHGGVGWNTDQVILVNKFNEWNGPKLVLNDSITKFGRLDRVRDWQFQDRPRLAKQIQSEMYADYHCLRPYHEHKEMNDFIVSSLCQPRKNVFSFCLYGPRKPYYYDGLLENIGLIGLHFPSWKVYVYYAPDVDDAMIRQLQACTSVVLRPTGVTGPQNMIHRFFAIDEEDVELMMVRDADSRVHWRDRWTIREFLRQPQFIAHTIRDHIEHTASMMGGLWGLRKSSGICVRDEYNAYNPTRLDHRWGHDQNFLSDVLYPKVVNQLLVHYSNKRVKLEENAVEIPFEWSNDLYCGQCCDVQFVDKWESDAPRLRPSGPLSFLPKVRDVGHRF